MEHRSWLPVSASDYDLLDGVREANEWSIEQATRRAIRAIWMLDQHLQAMEARHQGEVGQLIRQLRRELDPKCLVRPTPMRKVPSGDERPVRIRIEDFLFYMVDRALLAERIVPDGYSERIEISVVHDGQLTLGLSGPYSGPEHPDGVELC